MADVPRSRLPRATVVTIGRKANDPKETIPKSKNPKETPTRPRIDMSAMNPTADLVWTMFKQADKKLAAKSDTEKAEEDRTK